MRVGSASSSRAEDLWATQEIGVSGLVLMENASRAATEVVLELVRRLGLDGAIWLVAGRGNNGGDALAMARLLATSRVPSRVFLRPGSELSPDAQQQRTALERLEIPIEAAEREVLERALQSERPALWVDGLLGSGLSRPLGGDLEALVSWLDQRPEPTLALDVPTGLDASLASTPGVHWRAEATVTFGGPKVAHVMEPAARACGDVWLGSLGVPLDRRDDGAEHPCGEELLEVATASATRALLPERPDDGHKGTFGHVAIVGGSTGMMGAPCLAGRAALRSGAGLATLVVPRRYLGVAESGALECLSYGCGEADAEHLASEHSASLVELVATRDVVALGPGLGAEPAARACAREVALATARPLVVDADGLNAFVGRAEALRTRAAATILTPHPGEAARLLDTSTLDIQEKRLEAARRLAAITGAVVALKGRQTLVSEPEGGVTLIPTGNVGLATGGSGDVLTGVIAGLLAQGLDARDAAVLGCYLHGLAGDLYAQRVGPGARYGLIASDLNERLPAAISSLVAAPVPRSDLSAVRLESLLRPPTVAAVSSESRR